MRRNIRSVSKLASSLTPITLIICASGATPAEDLPLLWGYGVKSCEQFLDAAEGDEDGLEQAVSEYGRYEDWLTGFVSGLNLATGKDVLAGADIETALRRIRAHCRGHRKEDFFTATMDFVRMLSRLR